GQTMKRISIAGALAAGILFGGSPLTHATVIQDSSLVDIQANSNIYRDYRGPSSTRATGDRFVLSIKVSDTTTPGLPRDDTRVFVEQFDNNGDPTGYRLEATPFFGPAIPNEYTRSPNWNDSFLDGSWNIIALPNASTAPTPNPDAEIVSTAVNTIPSAFASNPIPLATDITLDGNGLLSWKIPETDVVYNNYRVTVIRESDRRQVTATPGTPIDWDGGSEKSISFNILGLYPFVEGEAYELRIETRANDPSRDVSSLFNRSSTFANFTLLPEGVGPVALPTVDMEGTFNFDFEVSEGEDYVIDPFVAIGYEYVVGAGDPLFESVMIPLDLTPADVDHYLLLVGGDTIMLQPNQRYDFALGGVSMFTILGIDPALMIDPANTTAFLTTLTFTGSGRFTGSMTPITQFVPVASPLSLALSALLPLVVTTRRRGRPTDS
ncbi:MAG TPA: hypothetical protein PLI17_02825, partial [Denitromonas sp.]|nr:hypothetical protein [Denitromonas sp.]